MRNLNDTETTVGSLRDYRNTIIIDFKERGDDFGKVENILHYKKWQDLIRFLRRRGFKVTENPSYKEHYTCLSPYHKIGHKKDVACLLEISSARIEIQFGNIKNLWKGHAQNFWDNPTDNRYTKLSYLENVAVKLEIFKVKKFVEKWNLNFEINKNNLSSVEKILHSFNVNSHIHGKVTCLNDIKTSIESGVSKHNQGRNSMDKNGKQIICGETKYFYDYNTKRLSCGEVWHHMNMNWYVLTGQGLKFLQCDCLFDYDPKLPRRKPIDEDKASHLLKRFESKQEYERCILFQNYLKKVLPESKFAKELVEKPMKLKTIEVPEHTYNFLINLSKELATQDNRCTPMPYFFQVETKEQVAAYDGCGDDVWVDEDGTELTTEDEIREFIFQDIFENDESLNHLDEDEAKEQARKQANKMHYYDMESYLEDHPCNWRKVQVTTEKKYQNAFLTAKACKEHIEANKHHYSEPSDYLTHAFRNPELEKVMEFILSLTKNQLHK